MKKILFFMSILLFVAMSCTAQIRKGTGVLYFDTKAQMDAFTPANWDGEIAKIGDSQDYWNYNPLLGAWFPIVVPPEPDHDFYDAATSAPPTSIASDVYTQGTLKVGDVGAAEAGTVLDIDGDAAIGKGANADGDAEFLRINGQGKTWYTGVHNDPTAAYNDFFISSTQDQADAAITVEGMGDNIGVNQTEPDNGVATHFGLGNTGVLDPIAISGLQAHSAPTTTTEVLAIETVTDENGNPNSLPIIRKIPIANIPISSGSTYNAAEALRLNGSTFEFGHPTENATADITTIRNANVGTNGIRLHTLDAADVYFHRYKYPDGLFREKYGIAWENSTGIRHSIYEQQDALKIESVNSVNITGPSFVRLQSSSQTGGTNPFVSVGDPLSTGDSGVYIATEQTNSKPLGAPLLKQTGSKVEYADYPLPSTSAPSDGKNYALVQNNGISSWYDLSASNAKTVHLFNCTMDENITPAAQGNAYVVPTVDANRQLIEVVACRTSPSSFDMNVDIISSQNGVIGTINFTFGATYATVSLNYVLSVQEFLWIQPQPPTAAFGSGLNATLTIL